MGTDKNKRSSSLYMGGIWETQTHDDLMHDFPPYKAMEKIMQYIYCVSVGFSRNSVEQCMKTVAFEAGL